jgi:hypothetical protein
MSNKDAWGDSLTPKTAKAKTTTPKIVEPAIEPTPSVVHQEPLFDLEGLMTDFPTAKELEKFVFDETGIVLNLKGRSNKFKYQTAMDVLNGARPDEALLGKENPYLDKNDLIPVDELKQLPARPAEVVNEQCVASFISKTFEHPDADFKANGQKCEVIFRKYMNNAITYEIIGPITTRAIGTRVNKFGKEVPEKYTWVDPRTGEQLIRTSTGMLTPIGTRLKLAMTQKKVNKSDYWQTWIDREFIVTDSGGLDNIWGA